VTLVLTNKDTCSFNKISFSAIAKLYPEYFEELSHSNYLLIIFNHPPYLQRAYDGGSK
jgi:hypothetical protein